MSNKLDCNYNGLHKVLFIGSKNGLFYVSLDTNDFIAQIVQINKNYQKNHLNKFNIKNNFVNYKQEKFSNIDYNPIDKKIYWIDRETESIKRCLFNGLEYEVIFFKIFNLIYFKEILIQSTNREISSMVIDWVGQNIIWSDSYNGVIELMKLDFRTKKLRFFFFIFYFLY